MEARGRLLGILRLPVLLPPLLVWMLPLLVLLPLLMLLPLLLLPLLLLFLLLPLLLRGPGLNVLHVCRPCRPCRRPLCCTAPLVVSAAHVKVGLCW